MTGSPATPRISRVPGKALATGTRCQREMLQKGRRTANNLLKKSQLPHAASLRSSPFTDDRTHRTASTPGNTSVVQKQYPYAGRPQRP